MITYRTLNVTELDRSLFAHFDRKQVVNKCRRKVNGEWVVLEDPFTDDWTEAEYAELIACLINTLNTGGLVAGAFSEGQLKGFVSVESGVFGGSNGYMDLSSIHVSRDVRGNGIGRKLFTLAKDWARAQGAKKLYISAHSAVESQAFYASLGCVEAAEYNMAHVEKEPCDCQLECEV